VRARAPASPTPTTAQTLNPFGDPGSPAGTGTTAPTGEGGALRAQDLLSPGDPTTLDGSVIRIDPNTGAALPDNPLYAIGNDANAQRIVAEGLRNPYRFTVRPGTNELWIGDVGWSTWEEINRLSSPTGSTYTNFGWPAYEGSAPQPGYQALNLNLLQPLYQNPSLVTTPYYAYNHATQVDPGMDPTANGSSITGLAFYAGGSNYPAGTNGALYFADFSRKWIWVMYVGSNGLPNPADRASVLKATGPVDLEVGPGGDLYSVGYDDGAIHRVQYFRTDHPPVAVATASPASGNSPLTVNLDATGSADPDAGDVLTYSWDLNGDGVFGDSTAAKPSYVFAAGGTHVVGLLRPIVGDDPRADIGELLACPLDQQLDPPFGHRLVDLPVHDGAAVAVQQRGQVVEGPADVQVRDVHVPVLVGLDGVLEAGALARRRAVELLQPAGLLEHPVDAGGADGHHVSVEHHER
jgi:PKD repeat protein